MLMMLVWGPYFENHYYVKIVSQKCTDTALQSKQLWKSDTQNH